ncbi:hypothetical protein [Metabacillus fastidiosus]|uniref:hypothetical protein n=1 Tax=Metabacillus fastidiosus TaxID=1458 RepID=UPI003D2B07D5
MNLRQNLIDIYMKLSVNEKLIRLLHYRPPKLDPNDSKSPYSLGDDPLSPSKHDLVTSKEILNILNQVLIRTDKTFDLTTTPINRICMYAGTRKPQHNYFSNDQDFVFDVYVHSALDEVDLRLTWICDTLNELMFNKEVTGASKIKFVIGHNIATTPKNWVGYKMVYRFIGLED